MKYGINVRYMCTLGTLHVYLLIVFHCYASNCTIGPKPCSSNPCGSNAICQDTQNGAGYVCTCKEGYTGQPFRGCTGNNRQKFAILCIFKAANLRTK